MNASSSSTPDRPQIADQGDRKNERIRPGAAQDQWRASSDAMSDGNVNSNRDAEPDDLVSRELYDLTKDERKVIYEEVHGVSEVLPETADSVTRWVGALLQKLSQVPKLKRKAYERAVFLKPIIAKDQSFHLMFLRACRYEPCECARRICAYFHYKLDLFGEAEILVRSIRIADLQGAELTALSSPFLRVLPLKDQSSRPIWFLDPRRLNFQSWREMARSVWYQVVRVCKEEDVQKRGVVLIAYCIGTEGLDQKMLVDMTKHLAFLFDLPVRFPGVHVCCKNSCRESDVVTSMKLAMGKQNRLHCRLHSGSEDEIRSSLLTFGIQLTQEMVSGNDIVADDAKPASLGVPQQEQEADEGEILPEGLCALYPSPNDVLLGRGRPFHSFTGNTKMGKLLDEYENAYFSCTERRQKTVVAVDIVKMILANGGRFLQRSEDGWIQVTEEVAKEKVTQALRMRRAKQKTSPPRAGVAQRR